jgi:hypothetical protein
MAVVSIAGKAGNVGYQRVARFGQAVEQRRFTDIGAADQCNDWFHF